jgi:hypothetical protein
MNGNIGRINVSIIVSFTVFSFPGRPLWEKGGYTSGRANKTIAESGFL